MERVVLKSGPNGTYKSDCYSFFELQSYLGPVFSLLLAGFLVLSKCNCVAKLPSLRFNDLQLAHLRNVQ
jgi:hypothetical protein